MRAFRYVGPPEIAAEAVGQPAGHALDTAAALQAWWRELGRADPEAIFTYVVTVAGVLRVASRRSEHVACAGGGDVLAAGELGFDRDGRTIVVATNQSTGYCPRVDCWPALATALAAIGAVYPTTWTHGFEFRRCEACGERAIVKDDWFECVLCGADLPHTWNF